jgi:AraC-like DNA-binding protein
MNSDENESNFPYKKIAIELEEVANLTNLSVSAFSRYFKSRTRKSYFQYLIEDTHWFCM